MPDFEYGGRELEVLADLPRYYDWIVECFRPYLKGAGVEFGAGLGTIASRVRPSLERLDLVEPSSDMIPELQRRFAGDADVRIFNESQEAFAVRSPTATYDVVVMVNVLEHIEDDRSALMAVRQMLRPGGHLLAFVPALQFLFSEFD